MKCATCNTKLIKTDLRMTCYVGPYKWAYECINKCKKIFKKGK